ncbi:MAG TPA: NYN domain-containing protein [Frankiaceae bacterium]|nr:NYN domain-containing protein [Frankiaceae bacterium]
MSDGVGLPEAARQRVLGYASTALGALEPADVPPALKRFASFTPAKRARLAGPALASVIEAMPAFRQAVATVARLAHPELAASVDAGTAPAAADPAEVAALAYLVRPDGWEGLVAAAADRLTDRAAEARAEEGAAEADRLRAEATEARRAAREEQERLRAEGAAVKGELDAARRAARQAADATRRAEAAAAAATAELDAVRDAAARDAATADTAARRARTRIAELESQLEAARRAGREGRSEDNIRLRVLLDAVVNAAAGLRRELALPPTTDRPADLVTDGAAEGSATPGARGRGPGDAKYLDALLAVPTAHLVVDGYNVTKTGYPTLSLEEQRTRLVAALRALAARTGAEITCVFDGAAVSTTAPVGSRQVRVHFTPPGRTADEAIAAFVAAEPPGRPVVVVSSDKEVADAARRADATAVPATTLLTLLGR